jgi:hypothetical protein
MSTTTIERCLDCDKKFNLDNDIYKCLICRNRYVCENCFHENHPINGKRFKIRYRFSFLILFLFSHLLLLG